MSGLKNDFSPFKRDFGEMACAEKSLPRRKETTTKKARFEEVRAESRGSLYGRQFAGTLAVLAFFPGEKQKRFEKFQEMKRGAI